MDCKDCTHSQCAGGCSEFQNESNRLRAELEKMTAWHDAALIASRTLRAELDKAQEEIDLLHNDGLTIYAMMNDKRVEAAESRCKELEELTDRQSAELTANAAEADKRIKELELALSGRTLCYDPDSYQKGVIAGMEEAARIAEDNCESLPGYCEDAIRARIEEVKNAKP